MTLLLLKKRINYPSFLTDPDWCESFFEADETNRYILCSDKCPYFYNSMYPLSLKEMLLNDDEITALEERFRSNRKKIVFLKRFFLFFSFILFSFLLFYFLSSYF